MSPAASSLTPVVTLTASTHSSIYGELVVITAAVAGTGPKPSGTVAFLDSSVKLGGAALGTNGEASFSTTKLAAGEGSIVASFSGDGNYSAAVSAPLLLTVGKATLTVTAEPENKVYGAPIPALAYSLSGFVNGDTSKVVTGAPKLETGATARSPVGSYPITFAAGTLEAANYAFQHVPGTLTIKKAPLIAAANNATVLFNRPLPAFGYTISGFVNGDSSTIVTGKPIERVTARVGSPIGSYPIIVSTGTLSAGDNYGIEAMNGTLTIELGASFQSYSGLGSSLADGCCQVVYPVFQVRRVSGVATVWFSAPSPVEVPPPGSLTSVAETSTGGGSFNVIRVPVTASTYSDGVGTVSYAQPGLPGQPETSDTGTQQATNYVHLLSSWLGVATNNLSVSGTTIADLGSIVYTLPTSATGGQLFSLEEGTNSLSVSYARENNSAFLPFYQSTELAYAYFLTQPDQAVPGGPGKIRADAACGASSGWSKSTLADPWVAPSDLNAGKVWAFQRMSDTAGAECSAQVFGSAPAVLYTVTTASGASAKVYADGQLAGTISATGPFTGQGALPLRVSNCSATGAAPERTVSCAYSGAPGPTATGQELVLQGMSDPSYNGTFYVAGMEAGEVSFINNLASGASASGGTMGVNLECIATHNFGRTFLPQIFQITGLTAAVHTIRVVIEQGGPGNTFYLDGFAGSGSPTQTEDGPTYLQFGTPPALNPGIPASLSSQWEEADRAVALAASSQGLRVAFVEDAASIGASGKGSLDEFLYPDVTGECTVTSGSNVLTRCSAGSGFTAHDFISDLGKSIPMNATVGAIAGQNITLGEPVASVSIATPGSGQTDVASAVIDSTGGGCLVPAQIELEIAGGVCTGVRLMAGGGGLGCTSVPSWQVPEGGSPCTIAAKLETPTATSTEPIYIFNPGVHPNGAGHFQFAAAALTALSEAPFLANAQANGPPGTPPPQTRPKGAHSDIPQ
jgi:hypothetical protein